ncbi:MAG: hypothetical protein IKH57_01975 [Clostridia bacterium]|nr:hypothetical protein [Clostridia bacterium]
MMYKSKCGQFAAAGIQTTPSMRLNVRSNVRLPDSEVGGSWYADDQKPFYAETIQVQKRGPLTVPLNTALLFLCVLFVVFGALALNRVIRKTAIAKDIHAMTQSIEETKIRIDGLTLQVKEARDSARIGYDASHRLQMVAASEAETVAVHAPSTRPFGEAYPTGTEVSPASIQGVQTIGSR